LTHQKDGASRGFFSSLPGQKVVTEFWALKNVNMEIEKGKVIGIIGRNGAGKTTLLYILAGISSPTTGEVRINGRVSSLLSLGAGFQDELTGKENIYLNASILNINRGEINKKYRSIVEFSELDGFLNCPLKVYSQGMRLRLGFSVAIHTESDIILTDEILSVGDVSFQKKCFDKIEEFRRQGKTMVITSQDLDTINRICDEVFLLENGEIVQQGSPEKVAACYLELLNEKKLPETFQRRYGRSKWWADKRGWEKQEGSKEVRITEVRTYNSRGKQTNRFKMGETVRLEAYFVVEKEVNEPHFGVAIFREDGVYCYGPNTFLDGHQIDKLNKGEGFFSIEYKSLCLKPGKYRFSTAVWDKNELWAYDYHVGFYKFEVIGDNKSSQLLDLKYRWEPDSRLQKLNIFQPAKPDAFFNPGDKAQNEILSFDIEMSSIELTDSSGKPKNVFNTGEDLKIKLQFRFLSRSRDYYVWVGLFRNDDVCCHSVSKKLKEETVVLIYPCFPLLSGDYYLSVGIWKKNQKEPLLYKNKAYVFKISFSGDDHGTVYLEHSWAWKLPQPL